MNIKRFLLFIIASITITTGLFGNEPQVSIQDIVLKLKNKELNVGDMASYEKNEYRIINFEEKIITDSAYNRETDTYSKINYKENYIGLAKAVTLFGIKIAEDCINFYIKENMQNPIETNIEFKQYRKFDSTYYEAKEIGVFGTCVGLTVGVFGGLVYLAARRMAADIAYYQSRK